MKKWYKESYFNSNAWILDNFSKLNLSSDEVLLLLLIDHAKKNNEDVDYDYLKSKFNYEQNKIDDIISSLVSKKYLTISPSNNGANFDISNLFEFDPESYELNENNDIYKIAEDLKGSPLSSTELQKVSDFIDAYPQNKIIDAFRTAEAYRKNSIAYVETVLRNDK